MKILITGGAGFIGSHIVDECIAKGHEVAVVDNLATGNKEFVNEKATFYEKDITKEELFEVFDKETPEMVIHCAAQVMLRKSIEEPLYDATLNILGTINVLEACREYNVKKIVYTSTGGARYGQPEKLPVHEDDPLKPMAPYGISKHTAEHYIEAYNEIYDIEYLIFCFGNVYGPRDDPSSKRVTSIFIDMILKGQTPKIFGDGEQTRDFIFVGDLAKFIVESMEKNPKHKLFNLANGTQVSVNQIFGIIKELSNFPNDAEKVDAIKGEVRDIYLDITRAKEELGWNPTHDINAGVKATYDWFKQNQK